MSLSLSKTIGVGIVTTFLATAVTAAADLPPDKYTEWSSDREIFVRMRDGVHLSTTVVRPANAAGQLPTVLVRSPYDDTSRMFGKWLWLDLFVRQGYAVVLQDERGRGFSEGYYRNYLQGASRDGYDTIDWIVKQPWSNGKVGTIGCSSTGEQQLPMAASNHPGHVAMIPGASGTAVGNVPGNETQGAFYRGGVPRFRLFAEWYAEAAPSERLLLPPDSTQELRIRLRNSYSLDMVQSKLSLDTIEPLKLPALLMHLPSKDLLRQVGGALTPFDKYITWTPADKRWNEVELIGSSARPRVPGLHVITWYDPGVGETTRLFKHLQDLGTPNQYLIVGPGPHCSFTMENLSDLQFGDLKVDARYRGSDRGYASLFLDWFDHWLNESMNHVTDMPKVQLYVTGEGWVSGNQWPLKGIRMARYFLGGGFTSQPHRQMGILSYKLPNRDEMDSYIYDPETPVPTLGGAFVSSTGPNGPARDQRPLEARNDVLVYDSPPLERPLTVVGPINVVLYVSSSAKDTDFMVKLVDVYPDGRAINLDDDAFRMRYREGFNKKVLMQQGGIYRITLTNMTTGIRFPIGHRIRLDISSSNFPEYERNLNTGGNNYDETTWKVAENSVHHGGRFPSRVELPLLFE